MTDEKYTIGYIIENMHTGKFLTKCATRYDGVDYAMVELITSAWEYYTEQEAEKDLEHAIDLDQRGTFRIIKLYFRS